LRELNPEVEVRREERREGGGKGGRKGDIITE